MAARGRKRYKAAVVKQEFANIQRLKPQSAKKPKANKFPRHCPLLVHGPGLQEWGSGSCR